MGTVAYCRVSRKVAARWKKQDVVIGEKTLERLTGTRVGSGGISFKTMD
jgi:hypothetical protein